MRSSSNLIYHILRQHAIRVSSSDIGLQANPLLCVLPQLLRSEGLTPTSTYATKYALPYSSQTIQPHIKVDTDQLLPTSLVESIYSLTCSFATFCSVQTFSMPIRSLFNSTEAPTSPNLKWPLVDSGRLCLPFLAFTVKRASFCEVRPECCLLFYAINEAAKLCSVQEAKIYIRQLSSRQQMISSMKVFVPYSRYPVECDVKF